MTYPSVKTLKNAFGDKALTLRKLIDGRLDPEDPESFPNTDAWIRQCFNGPSNLELRLSAIDEVLKGYGVEAIWEADCQQDEVLAEYINMGDTYKSTILYDHTRDKWLVTTWGDWVEWAERKRLITRED